MASVTGTVQVGQMETVHMKLKTNSSGFVPKPPAGGKQQRLKLDPLRALEPAKKKLSTLESQRIMAVLVESIKKVELVTAMPFILDNLDRFNVSLGSDLVRLLQDHKVIIESFQELKGEASRLLEKERSQVSEAEQRDEEEGEDDEEKYEDDREREISDMSAKSAAGRSVTMSQAESAMRNLQLVARQMQQSCKSILRAFSQNPAGMMSIAKEIKERDEHTGHLIHNMQQLKEIIMGFLLTTPVEELERSRYLREVSERERNNAKVIENLQKNLNAATDDKDADVKKKNDVIRRLQADLHQIERFSEEHISRTKSEAEKQQASDSKNSEGKVSKLMQELNQLKSHLQNDVQQHRDTEADHRRKKFKIETEVENWIQKYDGDMGVRQDEFEEIDSVYTEEKKQLHELEERFKTLETEYNQIMEERRVARERREAAERELQMSIKAATTIQAFWRSFKVRKALKSKKKKGGGKKKK